MAFCIMRIEKRKAGSLGGLEAEANRTEKINLPKSDILGVGAKDPAGAIDILNNDEWKTNICKEKRDNITLPIEHETDFIEQDIKEIMEITAPDAEDERPPEEIDEIKENDLEIDPFSIDEDEEEEDCIDFDEE